MEREAQRRAEEALRRSYGRLLAFLSSRSRDIESAQDALSEAFASALEHWPRTGVPDRPEAWLLSAARLRLIDGHRRLQVRRRAQPALVRMAEEAAEHIQEGSMFPERRLELMFACAHPSLAPSIRTPLILQTLLGMDAAAIGAAFLVPPATMSQRLVRAKRKVKLAGIPFEVPEGDRWPERMDAVLEAVYAAYTRSPSGPLEGSAGAEAPARAGTEGGRGLADEAIYLARLLVACCPEDPEALGLLALLLQCEARRSAGRDDAGRFVPLSDQDPSRWDRAMIDEARVLLAQASRRKVLGPFQIEAAIQMVHSRRVTGAPLDRKELLLLYEGLLRLGPSVGARVAHAAALGEAGWPEEALGRLDAIEHLGLQRYPPYWAVRAHLLKRLDRDEEARRAAHTAALLTDDGAVRDYLESKFCTAAAAGPA